jgi:hypothetical protein
VRPGSTAGRIVLTTIGEALSIAAARVLDVDPADIGGGHRAALNEEGARGSEVEVFLYDTAPGGAGFVRAAAEDPEALLRQALDILEHCHCSSSCYECLRSHKNRWDHADLDRHLGASFLKHILTGERPWIPEGVEDRLLDLLATDLEDQDVEVERGADGILRLPEYGDRSIIISHPLIREQPGSKRAFGRPRGLADRYLDQLLVDRALPAAVLRALDVGTSAADAEPPFEFAASGIPVYRSLAELEESGNALPEATLFADLPQAPEGSFIVQFDVDTMENTKAGDLKPFKRGSWHLFNPVDVPGRAIKLVRRSDGKAFQASGMETTLALVGPPMMTDGAQRFRLVYASSRPTCRAELINADLLQVLGVHAKALGA